MASKVQAIAAVVIAALLAAILILLASSYCVCGTCGAVSFGRWYVTDSSGHPVAVCGECYREIRALDL